MHQIKKPLNLVNIFKFLYNFLVLEPRAQLEATIDGPANMEGRSLFLENKYF